MKDNTNNSGSKKPISLVVYLAVIMAAAIILPLTVIIIVHNHIENDTIHVIDRLLDQARVSVSSNTNMISPPSSGSAVFNANCTPETFVHHLEKTHHTEMVVILMIGLVLLIFSMLLFYKLKRDTDRLLAYINANAATDTTINVNKLRFTAFRNFARLLNKMVLEKQKVQARLKKERNALIESEAKLWAMLETINDVIWETSPDAVYTYVSPRVMTILGYSIEEFIGKTPYDFIVPEQAEALHEIIETAIREHNTLRSLELTMLKKDGTPVILETTAIPIFDRNGVFAGYSGASRDITARKEDEKRLLQIKNLESIGLLAGGIAHDFNNILTGVYGYISMIKEELSPEHPAYPFLDEAEKSMERATTLTHQLLTFSKGGSPVREDIQLTDLIHKAADFFLSGSNIKLKISADNNLWTAVADKGQTQQIFANLIINAIQAMPSGGHITITLKNCVISDDSSLNINPGRYIRITISDEGVGIDSQSLTRIFDPYFTTKPNGTGLGLATVYSIIARHGGTIQVESTLNKGTTFTLYLPASNGEHNNNTPVNNAKPLHNISEANILIMDDDEIIRKLLENMLRKLGLTVVSTRNGEEAITAYRQAMEQKHPFHVVIMDLTIPGGMGGEEAVKHILEIDPHARVIASSGYTNIPVIAEYATFGFCATITKPYTMKILANTLESILTRNPSKT